MHHKFCVIDGKTALLGSYNWSNNAKKNFENLLLLNDELIIKKLVKEFKTLCKLTTEDILKLHNVEICKYCNGHIINLLILNMDIDEYYSSESKLVSLCGCGNYIDKGTDILEGRLYLESQGTIDQYTQNEILFSNEQKEFLDAEFDFAMKNIFSRCVDKISEVHAVGIIANDIVSQDGETEWFTNIVWKNKFVSHLIEDRYQETFGMI